MWVLSTVITNLRVDLRLKLCYVVPYNKTAVLDSTSSSTTFCTVSIVQTSYITADSSSWSFILFLFPQFYTITIPFTCTKTNF